MYGVASADHELDEDDSKKDPITVYARTKWEAEVVLKSFSDEMFTVVCFRPSTVFGSSPRLRCDIVFNNLVASAYTTGKVEIKSDGTPWRPVLHVRDACLAFIAGLEAPASRVSGRSFNVGIGNGNYSVRDLAEAAERVVPGSAIAYTGGHGADSRTYRVSFSRILTELNEWYKPGWSLDRGGVELVGQFTRVGFTEAQFSWSCDKPARAIAAPHGRRATRRQPQMVRSAEMSSDNDRMCPDVDSAFLDQD